MGILRGPVEVPPWNRQQARTLLSSLFWLVDCGKRDINQVPLSEQLGLTRVVHHNSKYNEAYEEEIISSSILECQHNGTYVIGSTKHGRGLDPRTLPVTQLLSRKLIFRRPEVSMPCGNS